MAATSLALNLEALASRAGELRGVAARVEEAAETITDAAALELELDALRAGAELDVSRVRAELAGHQQQLTGEVQSARAELAAQEQRAAALDGVAPSSARIQRLGFVAIRPGIKA